MLPEKIEIGHYRALLGCSVLLSDYTVMVGPNGAGKSTILQALRFFFEPTGVQPEDLQVNSEDEVRVTVTLGSLNADEAALYADALDANGKLVVTKSGLPEQGTKYTVSGKMYPAFRELRELETDKASIFSAAFRAYADEHPELGLAKPRSAADCKAELKRWEREHPVDLEDAEVSFEYEGSSKTQVIATTRVVYVPAVHHAGEDFRSGRSPLGQMIDALVVPEVEQKPEFLALRKRWNDEYHGLFPSGGTPELNELSARLSAAIHDFVPGASVDLRWTEHVPDGPLPDIESLVREDGVSTQIERHGHGLQRAMIMALLQAREKQIRESQPSDDTRVTHVLLLVEEPELYQHPPRARHFRRVLTKLATQPTRSSRFRVLCTTHSPDFVSLDDLESIRIVRKGVAIDGGVPPRRVTSIAIPDLLAAFAKLGGSRPLTEPKLRKNLHTLDGSLREAFFAEVIVLTEGVSDVGVLAAVTEYAGLDLEARGVVVSSTAGKGQLPLAITILTLVEIEHYVIFDSDTSAQLADNQRILRALGVPQADIPKAGTLSTTVSSRYAVLRPKMEAVLSAEFGATEFEAAAREAKEFFGLDDLVMKNPEAARYIVSALLHKGLTSRTLQQIIDALSDVRNVAGTTVPELQKHKKGT
jgi:putative ATP-dependent endonuclease of OLD family